MHEILWQQGAVDSLIEFLSSEHKLLQKVAVGALFGLLDYGIVVDQTPSLIVLRMTSHVL
jgi:hypothetical protein